MKLTITTWNLRTLQDNKNNVNLERRSAVIARELKRCNIDIAALSETHLCGQQSFEEVGADYTFFSSGVPVGEPQQAGVGFAIKSSIVRKLEFLPKGINSCLMLLRLNLPHGRYATLCICTDSTSFRCL